MATACFCAALSAPPTLLAQQNPQREQFANAEVLYDWVSNSRGDKLRTFVTHPKNISGKVPAIFFVGWLSCDSVEYVMGETDGFGTLMRRLIDQSGYVTVRMDKPGVGESQGKRPGKLSASIRSGSRCGTTRPMVNTDVRPLSISNSRR